MMVTSENPISALIAHCDAMAMKALEIEADARAGLTLTPDQIAEFTKGIREGFESMGTMMRTILMAIEQSKL